MKIEYNQTIQADNQAKIESNLNPFLWLVPAWVLFIEINLWDCDEDGKLATIQVDYAYRRLTINFSSAWLDRSDYEKQFTVIHELCHAFFGLIADYARDAINNLCPKSEAEKFNKAMQAELAIRHESATQDLAKIIFDKFAANVE